MISKDRVIAVLATAIVLTTVGGTLGPTVAAAHTTSDAVYLYTPFTDGDGDYSDVVANWATTPGTEPARHRCVFGGYGYPADYCVDIFASIGRIIISPFGSKTTTGHPTRVTVLYVGPGCASGRISDGGYEVVLEAVDASTGAVLGRGVLMHVNAPRVARGQTVGPWTPIGTAARFNYSSCYQVTSNSGTHVHLEIVQPHRYACYVWRSNGTPLTELTVIGKAGVHYSGQRAVC
jgi:hypothetical protein